MSITASSHFENEDPTAKSNIHQRITGTDYDESDPVTRKYYGLLSLVDDHLDDPVEPEFVDVCWRVREMPSCWISKERNIN